MHMRYAMLLILPPPSPLFDITLTGYFAIRRFRLPAPVYDVFAADSPPARSHTPSLLMPSQRLLPRSVLPKTRRVAVSV